MICVMCVCTEPGDHQNNSKSSVQKEGALCERQGVQAHLAELCDHVRELVLLGIVDLATYEETAKAASAVWSIFAAH